MKNKLKLTTAIMMITIISITTGQALAEPKPNKEIQFRQSGMMFMRWNLGIIKRQVIKAPHTYNKEQVTAAADVIAAVANSRIEQLFSQSSKTGNGWKKTRVKKEFFEQPEQVKQKTRDFKKEANTFAKIARTGDLPKIEAQFDVLFKACKACHKKYREKD